MLVEGRLQVRSYDDKDGQKKRVTEVVATFIGLPLEDMKPVEKADFASMGEEIPF